MRSWYDIDTLRESWTLLTLQVAEQDPTHLAEWELGDGNMTELVQTTDHTEATATGGTIATTLLHALNQRRYENRLLITDCDATVQALRRVLYTQHTNSTPTLRGFRHVSVRETLREYFDAGVTDDTTSLNLWLRGSEDGHTTVQRLWELWTEIAPLLPVPALRGEGL